MLLNPGLFPEPRWGADSAPRLSILPQPFESRLIIARTSQYVVFLLQKFVELRSVSIKRRIMEITNRHYNSVHYTGGVHAAEAERVTSMELTT